MSQVKKCTDYLDLIQLNSQERLGFYSGMECLDELIWFRKQILAIVTGHSSTGKSELVDQVCMNWAILHGYKTRFFSPENNPPESHWRKHIERYVGKQIQYITKDELKEATEFLDKHFAAIELGENELASIDLLMEIVKTEYEKEPFDIIVLDPWNECDFNMEDREDLYISKKLSQIKKVIKPRNLSCIIVAHPRTPREKITDHKGRQDYPPPKLHEISGGGNWKNKCEIGISCHRHPEDNELRVQVQKRKDKSYGNIGEVFIDYDFKTGRFKCKHNKEFLLPNQIEAAF